MQSAWVIEGVMMGYELYIQHDRGGNPIKLAKGEPFASLSVGDLVAMPNTQGPFFEIRAVSHLFLGDRDITAIRVGPIQKPMNADANATEDNGIIIVWPV